MIFIIEFKLDGDGNAIVGDSFGEHKPTYYGSFNSKKAAEGVLEEMGATYEYCQAVLAPYDHPMDAEMWCIGDRRLDIYDLDVKNPGEL
jgi:hypothetical protein